MILVKVLGERTDVAAYLSYYAKEELKAALGVKDNEVVFVLPDGKEYRNDK